MKTTATVCPVCMCWYAATTRRPGSRCGDLSHDQQTNCVGRVIPEAQFRKAEWFTLTTSGDQLLELRGRHPYSIEDYADTSRRQEESHESHESQQS